MGYTKILCTIGPACADEHTIAQLVEAGMNAARINFSHGDHNSNGELIRRVRKVTSGIYPAIPIIMDLQGPKIRTGKFAKGYTELHEGETFYITTEEMEGTDYEVSTSYPFLAEDVHKGDALYLNDGFLLLRVEDTDGTRIKTTVEQGGMLKNNKGINLVGSSIRMPAITDKDRKDLKFGAAMGVDFVALSFVRDADDIDEARQLLCKAGTRAELIAKIERPEALKDMAGIIQKADGIMIARGDLGVELPPEEIPPLQKSLIRRANRKGKIAITATQMLESMIENTRPTRAEASDVANAVFDGCDVVMLSGETASGKYPVRAVQTMKAIIEKAETTPIWYTQQNIRNLDHRPESKSYAVCNAMYQIVQSMDITAIGVFTLTGQTARKASHFRPGRPIYAFSPDESTMRRTNMNLGVYGYPCPEFTNTEEMIEYLNKFLIRSQKAKPGDKIVVLAGSPVGRGSSTNLLKIHEVHEEDNV